MLKQSGAAAAKRALGALRAMRPLPALPPGVRETNRRGCMAMLQGAAEGRPFGGEI